MTSPHYQRLTRKRRSMGGHTQLWLAPSHLLLVSSAFFVERYQRFFLSQIQSITVTRLPRRPWLQILLPVLGAACLVLLWHLPLWRWFFGIIDAIVLAWSAIDLLKGPECRCVLQTATGVHDLRPVSRMRTARRFLERVVPLIEERQGTLTAEDSIPATALVPPPLPQPRAGLRGAALPWFLFSLLLLNALVSGLVLGNVWAQGLPLLPELLFGEVVLAAATGLSRDVRSHPMLRNMVLLILLLSVVDISTTTGLIVIRRYLALMKLREAAPSEGSLWLSTAQTAIAGVAWRTVAGTLGLLSCLRPRRTAGQL